MVARSAVRSLVAILLALLLMGAYAAPSASAAGLRAAKCCADRCAKPRSADAARRCCPSFGAADDVGSFTLGAKAPTLEAKLVALATLPIALPSSQLVPASPSRTLGSSARAAPIFLRTLSLRI